MRLLARTCLAATALAVSACNCGEGLDVVPGDIAGRVCHPDTGLGLAGAAVVLQGAKQETGLAALDGRFVFERVPPGKYDIVATKDNIERTLHVEVASGDDAIITDEACRPLPPPGDFGILDGQICNRHTGDLVTDANVVITLADGTTMTTTTGVDGTFSIGEVPVGPQVVTISGVGYQRSFLVDIEKGGTTTLDLADDCVRPDALQGGVTGSFCDPESGGRLVGADVVATPVDGGESMHDLTDIEGSFLLNGMNPGDWRVEVTHDHATFSDVVTVRTAQFADVADQSSCATDTGVGSIQGDICDLELGGRFVGTVELRQGAEVIRSTVTLDGTFSFSQLVPAEYTVRATNASGERLFSAVVVERSQVTFVQELSCPDQQSVCTEFVNTPEVQTDGRIMLVVDKSGSMSQMGDDGRVKWESMRSSLQSVTAELTSTVEFGLTLYPQGDLCNAGAEQLGLSKNNAGQIANTLNLVVPEGGTPTAATLSTVRLNLTDDLLTGRPLAVLLATDGGPNCNAAFDDTASRQTCTCTRAQDLIDFGMCGEHNCLDDVNAVNEVARLSALGIDTYVIGVRGAESFSSVLNDMAIAGGTARPGIINFYEANTEAQLTDALQAITRRVLSCRVEMPGSNLNNVDSITVRLGTAALPRDTTHNNGWDIVGTTAVQLYGSACDLASASSQNVVVTTCN